METLIDEFEMTNYKQKLVVTKYEDMKITSYCLTVHEENENGHYFVTTKKIVLSIDDMSNLLDVLNDTSSKKSMTM